jgi:2,4-dienoyl-CoA reductase-like NADH-dependent reductase (Old Yellow Enzyme family)
MPHLFSKLRMRDVDLANRIGVAPMCQHSSVDGFANDRHFAHLAARAVGGATLVFTEAAAVTPEGRISPQDLGAWSEKHFEPLERITRFMHSQGARAGIQLAHAGRKGSTYRPGAGRGTLPEAADGWRATLAAERCPLFVRISATDWAEGGWDIDQSVELARLLLALGVDVIDCSSGVISKRRISLWGLDIKRLSRSGFGAKPISPPLRSA